MESTGNESGTTEHRVEADTGEGKINRGEGKDRHTYYKYKEKPGT